jgi:hypothetical protein
MAPAVDCSNYKFIGGQWYVKTPGGGNRPIPANQVPNECKMGEFDVAAAREVIAPSGTTKRAKPARSAKKKPTVAARGPKKRKAAARGPKKKR